MVSISDQVTCGAVGYATPQGPTIAILDVRPNPMTDHARLVVPEPLAADARIVLADASGRLLRTMPGNGSREVLIERAHLESGLYVVRVMRGGEHLGSARMIVE